MENPGSAESAWHRVFAVMRGMNGGAMRAAASERAGYGDLSGNPLV